jgi:uncharacterized protein YyaL (SSP411 family)
MYDGAVPSGNSVMASNLYALSIYMDEPAWRKRAFDMVKALGRATTKYPSSFGWWNCVLLELVAGTQEIAVLGMDDLGKIHSELLSRYLPHRVLMISSVENEEFALLAQKPVHSEPAIYVCKNFTCRQPVGSVNEVLSLINRA